VHPALRHRPMSGSGLRRHDARHRLIAPSARRETPLPASHRCRPGACEGACDALGHAKNTPSTADAATTSRSRSSVQRLLPPPMQPPREPPPRKIPIDRRPLTQPPRVPSLKAFRRRPSTPVDRPRRAAIRNPAQQYLVCRLKGSSAPIPAIRRTAIQPPGSTHHGRSHQPRQTVGSARKRTSAPNGDSAASVSTTSEDLLGATDGGMSEWRQQNRGDGREP
jgi:hypothetical protein